MSHAGSSDEKQDPHHGLLTLHTVFISKATVCSSHCCQLSSHACALGVAKANQLTAVSNKLNR